MQASFISKKSTIKPKSFRESGEFETEIEMSDAFVEIRSRELFEAPHVIFKLMVGDSKIPMAFVNNYLCFNSSFVGISAPEEDENALQKVYQRLYQNESTSGLYRAYILANSPKALVYHETSIAKEDVDNLPYPSDDKYLQASNTESIIINDVLKYYRHLGKSINKGSAGKILHDPITQPELKLFGQTFCEVLNDIYAEEGKSWQIGKVIETPTMIAYQLGFGEDGSLLYDYKRTAENSLHVLIDNQKSNTGIWHKRIIRHYQHIDGFDCVYLIKPKARRYWLQSIALRDADDTFMDLKKAGY